MTEHPHHTDGQATEPAQVSPGANRSKLAQSATPSRAGGKSPGVGANRQATPTRAPWPYNILRVCESQGFDTAISGGNFAGAAGVAAHSMKNRDTPIVADDSEVMVIRVSVPPPIPGVHIPWNEVAELPPFIPNYSDTKPVTDGFLPEDALQSLHRMQTWGEIYAQKAEARLRKLNRERLRIAGGLDGISVRIHRLQVGVEAHYGEGVSATGDLYAQALQGDAEALAVVWSADLDGSPFIDELREILAALAELMAQAETLNVWESLLAETPTTLPTITASTEPPPPIPARDFVVSARTLTGPPVAA